MSYNKRAIRVLFLILSLGTPVAGVSAAALTGFADVDHHAITIWSQGVRLAGDLYKPKGLQESDKLPGILLVTGWGGSKENLKKNYAPHFARRGFVVLAFDYKSWGQSDGPLVPVDKLAQADEAEVLELSATHIRKVVNPYSMLADIRASLNYLSGEPQVVADNLGLWGTSFGGALSLVIAASDDRIKAYVNQMGPINFTYNYKDLSDQMASKMAVAMARGELPPFPGPEVLKNPGLRGYPDWSAFKRFNPMREVAELQVPTLIIDAEGESLFDRTKNGQLLHQLIKDRVASRYVVYPGKHYDMYQGDNRKASATAAIDWFLKYLKGSETTVE
jgi:dienelactone hydrolase